MLDENAIIQTLAARHTPLPEAVVGIGDDAAVIPCNDHDVYVISKDLLIEDRHFRRRTHDPESIAHKALHVNLSDCAAMGATPQFVLLGLAVPEDCPPLWVETFSRAFLKACGEANVALIGGDTTGAPVALALSVTIIGRAPRGHVKYRHGGRPEDVICAAGSFGLAHAGLIALERDVHGLEALKKHARQPVARVAEGMWLGAHAAVTAMLDLSDGLVVDMPRLAHASGCGAVITLGDLVPDPMLVEGAAVLGLDPLACMVSGGEDYALVCTVDRQEYPSLTRAFSQTFGYTLTPIGVLTHAHQRKEVIRWMHNGQAVIPPGVPFSHFVASAQEK